MAPPLNEQQRKEIIRLRKKGFKVSEICKITGVARKTIYFWLRRHEETGALNVNRRKIYPRATNPQQDAAIVSAHLNNPFKSTRETSIQFNVSIETVRRRIKEAGLKFKKTKKKSLLEVMEDETVKKDNSEIVKNEDNVGIDNLQENYSIDYVYLCKIEMEDTDKTENASTENSQENITENSVYLPQIKTEVIDNNDNKQTVIEKATNFVQLPETKIHSVDVKVEPEDPLEYEDINNEESTDPETKLDTPKHKKKTKKTNKDTNTRNYMNAKQRAKIVELSEQGKSIREIAREMNIARSTVRTWIKRHAAEGALVDRRRYNHGGRRISNRK